jgi:hypothetical protein
VPSVTGAVPTTSVLKVPVSKGAISRTYLRKLASLAVPMMGTAVAILAPSAGEVIAAVGSVLSSAVASATLKTVLPVTPAWLALMVVLPSPSAVATPAASMLATVGLLLAQTRPLFSGRLEPLERMPVAVKACVWPLRINGSIGVTRIEATDTPGGPLETTRFTARPLLTSVPAAGSWLITWPAATLSLLAVATVPTPSAAVVIMFCAVACS